MLGLIKSPTYLFILVETSQFLSQTGSENDCLFLEICFSGSRFYREPNFYLP